MRVATECWWRRSPITPSICSTSGELCLAGIQVQRRFKGYEPSEIIGQHFSNIYTDEDKAAGLPQRALEIAAREGKFENEGWRVRKDGTKFWAYVIIDPIRDNKGKLVGFAKVTRDLTERMQAEAELRKSQELFRLLCRASQITLSIC
jgi:PAS domain S-box-containing protein